MLLSFMLLLCWTVVGEVTLSSVEHMSDTVETQPIHQIPQRVPFALQEEITKVVQEILKVEVIQESASLWPFRWPLSGRRKGHYAFAWVIGDSVL